MNDDYSWIIDGYCPVTTVHDSPEEKNLPVFTGVLRADGTPILRRPVRYRLGFHMPDKKISYGDSDSYVSDEDEGVIGWVYDD